MTSKTKSDVILSTNLFLVVGIGASAGGLEAFKQLIGAIPIDSGMAYILVQHLDPNHESILPELLQKITLIPVHEITDNVHVEPDNIYVIPPRKTLTANNGILNLTTRTEKARSISIDLFFTSLAEVHQSYAIGVVLSGTGKDGTDGLKAIKAHGGVTFAQQQKTAAFNEMPQSAIDAGVVDFVLPPEGIVRQLMEISNQQPDETNKTPSKPHPEDIFFRQLLNLINIRKAVDFTYYKQTTIRRRIARRMVLLGLKKIADYVDKLNENPTEVDILFQDMLIPVTEFFRDPKMFSKLYESALPVLVKNKTASNSIRVWVVGCSTGQEAYSLAISIFEFLEDHGEKPLIQIFATDLSEKAISKARMGLYTAEEAANVSSIRLEKFFNPSEGGYQINKWIRDRCIFSKHNLISDPPFSNIDLISCRNVLIYMDMFLQRKAMAAFHYSLKPNGILLLGKSESLGSSTDLFASLSDTERIYTKKSVPVRFAHASVRRKEDILANSKPKESLKARANDDFERNADDIILAMSPNGVIVNDQLDIVQFRGSTGDWLESATGKPSLNVLKMARRGLVLEVRNVINKVKSSGKPIIKEGIPMKINGRNSRVTLRAMPLLKTINPYILILFESTEEIPEKKRNYTKTVKEKNSAQELRAQELEVELNQTREDLRTFAEDYEAGNEELLSANEELTSHSEELRSLNEELEISKEELQSTVEELSASNQELAVRNEEFHQTQIYSEGIITTIREPLIILDRYLRIKSANRSFYKTFGHTQKEAEGGYFYELGDGQWNIPDLRLLLDRTMMEADFYESYEVKQRFLGIGERVMLLNARRIQRDGNSKILLLLAIEDVTDRRKLENQLKENSDYLKAILDSSLQLTSVGDPEGSVNYFSKSYLDYSGISLEEAIKSRSWNAIIHPDMITVVEGARPEAVAKGEIFNMEILLKRHDGEYRWHSTRTLPIRDSTGKVTFWVETANDIHDQKTFSSELERQVNERTELLKEANLELAHSNENLEQFAFIASHDLQEPLRKIKTFSDMLLEKYIEQLPKDGKVLVDRIFNSANRMSTLIKDVLNFSRIENGLDMFTKTNLDEILDNVLTDLNLLLIEKKAVVNREPLPVIEAIPFQMNQLFLNLIGNSLKFAKSDVPMVIGVSTRKLAPNEVVKFSSLRHATEYIEIMVNDNGIGFDQQYAEKIFSIFQRLNSSMFSGNGIGLALCKKIVLNHSGHIEAQSEESQGSSFRIILPLTQIRKDSLVVNHSIDSV